MCSLSDISSMYAGQSDGGVFFSTILVHTITCLFHTDYSQPPLNVSWSVEESDRLIITWNPWIQPQCSSETIRYIVMIVSLTLGYLLRNVTTSMNTTVLSSVSSSTTYIVIVRTAIGTDQLHSETASTLTFTTAGEIITSKLCASIYVHVYSIVCY